MFRWRCIEIEKHASPYVLTGFEIPGSKYGIEGKVNYDQKNYEREFQI